MSSDPSGAEPTKMQLVPYSMSWQTEIIEFAKRQGAAAIILGVLFYYLATWVDIQVKFVKEQIPIHLESIKAGYREVSLEHLNARKESDRVHAESLKVALENCEKNMDRTERILSAKVNANARKVEEVANKVNAIVP